MGRDAPRARLGVRGRSECNREKEFSSGSAGQKISETGSTSNGAIGVT